MTPQTAVLMNRLNHEFYATQAASFSQTRQAAWPGWGRCLEGFLRGAPQHETPISVLDLACGNLRFARFLAGKADSVTYVGVDSCPQLSEGVSLPANWNVRLSDLDIVSALLTEGPGELDATSANLAVCFGFLHHVPTFAARVKLLRTLLRHTAPNGTCCVSLWRFMANERLAAKARLSTVQACEALGLDAHSLDENDYLLGWEQKPGVWRYCHHFDNAEADALVEATHDLARLSDRFLSDGRGNDLNTYLVFQRL